MKAKKIALSLSLIAILACGVYASIRLANSSPTYDGSNVDLVALYEDPTSYDNSNADGVGSVIVNENLDKTAADNVVFSVVFNFRGYDTLGESFILIASIAGSMVILRQTRRKQKEEVH